MTSGNLITPAGKIQLKHGNFKTGTGIGQMTSGKLISCLKSIIW